MNQESRIKNGKLNAKSFSPTHHAYAIKGGARAREKLFEMLESSWGVAVKANPDFSYQRFSSLGVGEARNLKELQEKKSFAADGKKIFVIEADAITAEAQNSLLKIFEEPTANTHFFVIGNCVKNLIPTLNSRVEKMTLGESSISTITGVTLEFLKSSTAKRLDMIKKLSEDIKEEKKTKNDALTLLHEIESTLYERQSKDNGINGKLFENLELCREYMSDRSAGVKMLLEYVALVSPRQNN